MVKNTDQDALEIDPPDPNEPPEEAVDESAEIVKALASLAAEEAVDNRSLNELGDKIDQLSPAAQKILVDSPLMQRLIEKASDQKGVGALEPGQVYKAGPISFKKPWRLDDLDEFPKKAYTTSQREEWTWNGITFVFEEDEQYEVPEPVHTMIMLHKEDAKKARKATREGFGMGVKQLSAEGWAGKEAEDKKGGG